MNKFRNFEKHDIYDSRYPVQWTDEDLESFERFLVLDPWDKDVFSDIESWRRYCYRVHHLKTYEELNPEEKARCDEFIHIINENLHFVIESQEDEDAFSIAMDETRQRNSDYFDKKRLAKTAYLESKCGKSKIKHWFYFGRKWFKDDKGEWVYHTSLYEKIRYKAFLKYIKNIEKNGLEIKRPYYYEGKSRIYLYNCSPDYYGSVFRRIKEFFGFHTKYQYRTCWFDHMDIESYIIISLTVKGLGHFVHGNTTSAKHIGHLCWKLRKEIINAKDFEDTKDYFADKETCKKFGITVNYSENIRTINEAEYLKHGYKPDDCKPGVPMTISLDPRVVESLINRNEYDDDESFRRAVLDKMKDIDAYRMSFYQDSRDITRYEEILKEAYGYLGMKMKHLWD